MGDIFKEQIVKKEATSKELVIKIACIVLDIILTFVFFTLIPSFAPILIAVVAFGTYYLFGLLDIEYEYIFTNGELDIDCIYSKTRRKRVFSGRVSEFEIIAHIDDKAHTSDFNPASETKNYASGNIKNNTYAFLSKYKGKKLKIIIEPNEMMVQALSTAITPRKFFKKI